VGWRAGQDCASYGGTTHRWSASTHPAPLGVCSGYAYWLLCSG